MSNSNRLDVTFFPPLFLQRRLAILQVIRQESVKSILDIGCGEGGLLSALCQPAPWLPEEKPDSEDIIPIYPKSVAGLDIDDLAFATQAVQSARSDDLRWTPLKVKLWKGGLQSFNPDFVGIECIVASEVIEHLPEEVLPELAPMILGVYRPRLFIITTPNYTFNARFTAPDSTTRDGYLDPTGRTNRVFRHSDHKFEWTVDEFVAWCQAEANTYGYVVQTHTIGHATEKDPWQRDEQLGGATQIATFTRIRDSALPVSRASPGGSIHKLVLELDLVAHPRSGQSSSLEEIGEAIRLKMEDYREAIMRLEELWFEQNISVLCGGSIDKMIAAVEAHPKLTLVSENYKRSLWQVQLVDGIVATMTNAEGADEDNGEIEEPFEVPLDWGQSIGWGEGNGTDDLHHGWGA